MGQMIPLMKPDIREEDIDAVATVLRSGMLVQGEKVLALESLVKDLVDVPYCACASSGTAALHLALIALGIGKGDEVIVPAFSFVATANVVELVGARCVFVDIDASTFTIDVTKVDSVVTKNTKAIIPVHEFGLCADMEGIMQIAKKHSLYVIEDAACALGASQNGKMAGSFGDFGAFSLHPRKAITSGEGGLLTTHHEHLDLRVKCFRNHGIAPGSLPMDFVDAGFNYRMTDFQAALVSSQFARLHVSLKRRDELARCYLKSITNVHVQLPWLPSDRRHTWQTFHILVDSHENREKLMRYLKEDGISTNYGAQCIPSMTYYARKYGTDASKHFPNAWAAFARGLALPLYSEMTGDQNAIVISTINAFQPHVT